MTWQKDWISSFAATSVSEPSNYKLGMEGGSRLHNRPGCVLTSRILSSKLITREADDFKVVGVLRLEVLVEFLEPSELGCEAAFRGRVDNEDDFV